MKTVSVKEMRELDRKTMQEAGIDGRTLMERAGNGAGEIILEYVSNFDPRHLKRFIVLAGRGNNGGDAYVTARYLHDNSSVKIKIFAVCPVKELGSDSNWHARRISGEIQCEIRKRLSKSDFRPGDIIIDGLLGTGASGELREPYRQWIDLVNGLGLPVISLDLPSGLDGDTGLYSTVVRADLTIAMGLPKKGFASDSGSKSCGIIKCVDIGIPEEYINCMHPKFEMIFDSDVRKLLGRIPVDSHKKNRGVLVVIGGSRTYQGAPLLSAKAALRTGCGFVTVVVPDKTLNSNSPLFSLVTHRIPGASGGIFDQKSVKPVKKLIEGSNSVVIGPGIGTAPETGIFLSRILRTVNSAVLDADALNLFSNNPESIDLPSCTILTPHPGEMKRLLDATGLGKMAQSDRMLQAKTLAEKLNAIVVLKGKHTVVASKNRVSINSSGSSALATAGTGDVLSGIIGTFLAQGYESFEAATCGVFIHGLAAEMTDLGQRGMNADDLADLIPRAMKRISPFA